MATLSLSTEALQMHLKKLTPGYRRILRDMRKIMKERCQSDGSPIPPGLHRNAADAAFFLVMVRMCQRTQLKLDITQLSSEEIQSDIATALSMIDDCAQVTGKQTIEEYQDKQLVKPARDGAILLN